MQNAATYLPTLHANASLATKGTAKSCAQILMSVRGPDRAASTPTASTRLETTLVCASMALKVIHMMDVPTSMNVSRILVDRELSVRISRVVIAAIAQTDMTEMPAQQDASTTTNALARHAAAMRNVSTRLARSNASVPKEV